MRRRAHLTLALLLTTTLVALAPTAAAAPACADITTPALTPVGPYLRPVQGENAQYHHWVETNLVAGLQEVECVGADGATVAPDRYMGVVGLDSGGQPICIIRVGCI